MYFRQLIILHQRQEIYFYKTVLKNLLKIDFVIPWNECLCIQASLEPVNLYNIIQVTLHQVCHPHDNLVSQHTKCGRSYQYMYKYLGINVMNQMYAFWTASSWMKKKSIVMIHLLPQYWYDKIKMADLKFEKKSSVGVNLPGFWTTEPPYSATFFSIAALLREEGPLITQNSFPSKILDV